MGVVVLLNIYTKHKRSLFDLILYSTVPRPFLVKEPASDARPMFNLVYLTSEEIVNF